MNTYTSTLRSFSKDYYLLCKDTPPHTHTHARTYAEEREREREYAKNAIAKDKNQPLATKSNDTRTLVKLKVMKTTFEPWHMISNNVVCATSKASDQPAHARSLIRAFASRLNIL